jgi:hypothetical protein
MNSIEILAARDFISLAYLNRQYNIDLKNLLFDFEFKINHIYIFYPILNKRPF